MIVALIFDLSRSRTGLIFVEDGINIVIGAAFPVGDMHNIASAVFRRIGQRQRHRRIFARNGNGIDDSGRIIIIGDIEDFRRIISFAVFEDRAVLSYRIAVCVHAVIFIFLSVQRIVNSVVRNRSTQDLGSLDRNQHRIAGLVRLYRIQRENPFFT